MQTIKNLTQEIRERTDDDIIRWNCDSIDKALEDNTKNLQNNIDILEEEFVWYCMNRAELDCPTKEKAKKLLNDFTADWDWENLCWEQWYLEWIRYALNFIKQNAKSIQS